MGQDAPKGAGPIRLHLRASGGAGGPDLQAELDGGTMRVEGAGGKGQPAAAAALALLHRVPMWWGC